MSAGCSCVCNSGGFCGGCGHAGCGGRSRRMRPTADAFAVAHADALRRGVLARVASLPTCSLCEKTAAYDAKTKLGPWAYLCEEHFDALGIGLGTGKGQRLQRDEPSVAELRELHEIEASEHKLAEYLHDTEGTKS